MKFYLLAGYRSAAVRFIGWNVSLRANRYLFLCIPLIYEVEEELLCCHCLKSWLKCNNRSRDAALSDVCQQVVFDGGWGMCGWNGLQAGDESRRRRWSIRWHHHEYFTSTNSAKILAVNAVIHLIHSVTSGWWKCREEEIRVVFGTAIDRVRWMAEWEREYKK